MGEFRLTVAVSSGVNEALCRRLVESVDRQSIRDSVQLLIAAPGPDANLARARNRMYAAARAPWVYFLDEDCELPDDGFLERLVTRLESVGGAVGGGYLLGGGLWQSAYNALTSYWLDLHARQGQGLPVAGNFAMPRLPGTGDGFPFALSAPFGGEEILLREALLAVDIPFALVPEFSVRHNSSKSGAGFFRRAWTHGSSPRMPTRKRAALRGLRDSFARIADVRVRALMIAYLMTVVTARVAWALAPKKIV